jgi:hypothetical protein
VISLDTLHIEFLGGKLGLVVTIGLIFLAAAFFYYRRTNPPLRPALRRFLLALRIIALAALIFSLMQPVISWSQQIKKRQRMAVLLDESRSMTMPVNARTDRTRLDLAQEIVNDDLAGKVDETMDVDRYVFAEKLDSAAASDDLTGATTNLGGAVRELIDKSALSPFDYIVVVSDGRATEGEQLADVAASYGRPIHTIAVGDSSNTNDIILENVLYNDVVYAGKESEIGAVVSQHGANKSNITVRLLDGKTVLVQKAVEAPGDGRQSEVSLSFTPAQPGQMALRVEVSASEADVNPDNNRRRFIVNVLKSKLAVLLYSSSVNQEYAFLNRFLSGQEDYDVTRVVDAPGGDRLGERFPASQEALNSFDAIILIDPNLVRLGGRFPLFSSYLSDRNGGILFMMGQQYANSANGSPIAALAPLVPRRSDRAPRVDFGTFVVVPDHQMIFHPAVRLGETREEILSVWEEQPPFSMYVGVDSINTGATALAYLETSGQRYAVPAIAAGRSGGGKTLAFAVAPLWSWAFQPIGVGQSSLQYEKLVMAMIRWLTVQDESERVRFEPDKEVFESVESVGFSGALYDEGFRPIDNATGELVIRNEDGDTTVVSILSAPGGRGKYTADAGTLPPGVYTYDASLSAESIMLGKFSGKFIVDDIDRETALSEVDWTALAAGASASGGEFVPYYDAANFVSSLDQSTRFLTRATEFRAWDHTIVLVIILACLGIEWIIRKRAQLL